MKKTTVALLFAFTVILFGIAGYGGAYLAKKKQAGEINNDGAIIQI